MKNTLTLIVLAFCFAPGRLPAQNINRDSLKRKAFNRDSITRDSIADVARITTIAKTDGRRLRLSTAQRQKFNADKKNVGSDLLKPRLNTVSDTLLLSDSVYVKAFRMAAYNKELKYRKRTTGHYILVGGIVAASAVAAVLIAAVIAFAIHPRI